MNKVKVKCPSVRDDSQPGGIEYTEVRNFAQGEEEWASHRDSATMDVA